jgi:hypothetical protein
LNIRRTIRCGAVIAGCATAIGTVAVLAAGSALAAAPVVNSSPDSTVTDATVDQSTLSLAPDVCGPSNAWVAMLGNNFDIYLCGVTTVDTARVSAHSSTSRAE